MKNVKDIVGIHTIVNLRKYDIYIFDFMIAQTELNIIDSICRTIFSELYWKKRHSS